MVLSFFPPLSHPLFIWIWVTDEIQTLRKSSAPLSSQIRVSAPSKLIKLVIQTQQRRKQKPPGDLAPTSCHLVNFL